MNKSSTRLPPLLSGAMADALLTLQRRHECCPSRLQETPKMGERATVNSHIYPPDIIGYTSFSALDGDLKEKAMTHIWMFLLEGPGSSPGARTDRPRTGSSGRRSSGRFALLFTQLQAAAVIFIAPPWTCRASVGRESYRDPTHRGHTRCSRRPSGGTRRRGCSDISYRDTPRLRRSRTLLPFDQHKHFKLCCTSTLDSSI